MMEVGNTQMDLKMKSPLVAKPETCLSRSEISCFIEGKKQSGRNQAKGILFIIMGLPWPVIMSGMIGVSGFLFFAALGMTFIMRASRTLEKQAAALENQELALLEGNQETIKKELEALQPIFNHSNSRGMISCVAAVALFLLLDFIEPFNFLFFFGGVAYGVYQFIFTSSWQKAYMLLIGAKSVADPHSIMMTCQNCGAPITATPCEYCGFEG